MSMTNNWKTIWNRRTSSEGALKGDWQEVFLELKRLNGYDVMEGGVPLNSWLTLHAEMKKRLRIADHASVFEVGCGAGANLYLFARDGLTVGGTDYAAALVDTARSVLPDAAELYCGEADSFPTERTYTAAISNGVFSYFTDEEYATRVLERMLAKSTDVIWLMELHDKEREEAYHTYRRATIPDYDEHYKGLDKLFYTRDFFADFARKHNLRIDFPAVEIEGYWNVPFIFNVFMYRK